MPINILANDKVAIWYHPEHGIIHHEMYKYLHGESFREVMLAGAEAMKKYKANKWLSDDRKNPVLAPDDLEWSNTVWTKMVMEAGWKYWAIVQPEALIAKMRMDKLAQKWSDRGLAVQFFTDPDEAMKWLESQK